MVRRLLQGSLTRSVMDNDTREKEIKGTRQVPFSKEK